jgi:mannose-1-phosphate guanylyltransferase/mannose-1-phosphate guanylyltransferase/mannose-6-phosphate isomerase
MAKVFPVVLSGGTGSRLWPLSRESYPKQLLPLAGSESMLQQVARRASDPHRFETLLVLANSEHRFVIAEQLRAIGIHGRIVLEPEGRNTAPAAAVAALIALREHPHALILIMPADHVIGDEPAFQRAVEAGIAAAEHGSLVLFGIRPDRPETGYGYIRVGEPLERAPGAHRVLKFVEKPNEATAEEYLGSRDYVWNSGIFLLPAGAVLEELERFAPQVLRACEQALAQATSDLDFLRLDPGAFGAAPSISLDYAVMEGTKRAAVIPVDFSWSDVGAWSALWQIGNKDEAGNVLIGDALVDDASGCYVRGEGQLVAAIGVEDLIVVATPDAVLVTSKKSDQKVKAMVDRLKRLGSAAATQTSRVYRPWGYYESIHRGDRFQVKRITVSPGAKLSLQKHYHRAEHWIVVNGTALVTRDGEEILLRENESLFLPLGCVHRLENPGRVALNLIEVQSGPYLGEDDIVRIEDIYARV